MTTTNSLQVLTKQGEALLARLAAEEKELVIDKFIFADVPDRGEFPSRDETIPSTHVVHKEAIGEKGRLTENSVIYTATLASNVGPFHFNWSGLYCSEHDVLVTVHYPRRTPKTADQPGIAGNTLVRSQVLQYTGVADITNITVDASTWQYNANDRMKKMDSDLAQANIDQNGKDWFIEDGFQVLPKADNSVAITPGAGYVSGNRISLGFERIVPVPNKPSFIYIDAQRTGTSIGEQVTTFNFVVSAEEKDDYTDEQGVKHFVCKIAQVLVDGGVSDLRPEGESASRDWVTKNSDLTLVIIKAKSGENVTQELHEISEKYFKQRIKLKFPEHSKLYLDPVYTHFSESIIDLGTCHIVPTTENQWTWINAGQRNRWMYGKFEPENYTDESRYWGVHWCNDERRKHGSQNKWMKPFMYGMHRAIEGMSDDSDDGACYRHEILFPDLTGLGKDVPDGFGVRWSSKSGRMGDSAGNDSKVIGGTIRSFTDDVICEKAFAPKFTNVGTDGAVNAYRNIGSNYLQIVNQYTEYCDNGLALEDAPYGTQMIGGTIASSVTNKITGSQHKDLPVYVVSVAGVQNCHSIGIREEGATQHVLGANSVGLGLFDGIDNLLLNEIFLKVITADALGFDCSQIFQDAFHLFTGDKDLRLGSNIPVTVNKNGEIELANGRFFKGLFNVKEQRRTKALAGNTIFLEEGTGKLLMKMANGSYKEFHLMDETV